jgi:hypothetical protein
MPYKTRPIQPDMYITQIDVFHQLHCLVRDLLFVFSELLSDTTPHGRFVQNAVRMAHHRSYYENTEHFRKEYGKPGDPKTELALYKHLEHCIEGLRQSIMCSSDISPIVWKWTGNETLPSGNIVHTCRDWKRVHDWGKSHILNDSLYDPYLRVLDPLQNEK